MRRPRFVARMALIATLAAVAVPGPADSISAQLIGTVAYVRGPLTTMPTPDPGSRSDGTLDHRSRLLEPNTAYEPPPARPKAAQPQAKAVAVSTVRWRLDRNVSWYGPGFYGKRTACGRTMSKMLVGVAHRSLPCGTKVTFRNPADGTTVTAPVVDRGPYVGGRTWDLTRALCMRLDHCYTGSLYWRRTGG